LIVYLLKRLILAIPTLLIASFLIFSLVHIAPGDPIRVMLGQYQDPELIARLREAMGLDLPFHVQYLRWLGKVLQGDLGLSITVKRGASVAGLIAQRFSVTVELATFSLIIALLIAIPTGVISALRQNRLSDHISRIIALAGVSIPNFFLGILLILFVGVYLRQPWGAGGYVPFSRGLGRNLAHMFLPAVALGTAYAAIIMRMMRSAMLDAMSQDFVRTARAMGIAPGDIVRRDIVKNALIPVVTVIGNSIGYLLGGSIVTETVFRLPGVGNLVIMGVFRRDFPVIQAVVLIIVVVRIIINLVVDLTYGFLDPRIRYGGER
jgi:peptide/nickel transport system permease protein